VGFSDVPPAYPTRVRTTPSRLPNWESEPQNQPRANVAVSVCVGAAASIGGMVPFRAMISPLSAVCHGVHADNMTNKGATANFNIILAISSFNIRACYYHALNVQYEV